VEFGNKENKPESKNNDLVNETRTKKTGHNARADREIKAEKTQNDAEITHRSRM
jgi:hypothetical protein